MDGFSVGYLSPMASMRSALTTVSKRVVRYEGPCSLFAASVSYVLFAIAGSPFFVDVFAVDGSASNGLRYMHSASHIAVTLLDTCACGWLCIGYRSSL